MCGLEKVSHKNVIDSTISLFFRAIPLLVSLFFVTLSKDFKNGSNMKYPIGIQE